MSKLIKMLTIALVLVNMLLVSVTGSILANERIEGPGFDIEVSPNVLNIDSFAYGNSGNIHTNIPVSGLTVDALEVNGTAITFVKGVDNIGHLVLNFDMDAIEGILVTEDSKVAENANFVLTCYYVEGNVIEVEDTVPVINVP